jgi:rhodanese-related sulfurtransferase
MMPLTEISVQEFAEYLAQVETPPQLIDVREPEEAAIAQIEGFTLYPLSQYQDWSEPILQTLDPNAETFVLCHHGMRSAQMCQWLRQQGFIHVRNITGGIDAYSCLVNPAIPRY